MPVTDAGPSLTADRRGKGETQPLMRFWPKQERESIFIVDDETADEAQDANERQIDLPLWKDRLLDVAFQTSSISQDSENESRNSGFKN
jgi:hypothetical protein